MESRFPWKAAKSFHKISPAQKNQELQKDKEGENRGSSFA
jgi:hypothetical protein